MKLTGHTRLRPFQKNDLAPIVDFWNNAFADRRNFYPITAADFQSRVLDCEVFDPNGLILAWYEDQDGSSHLAGMVHGFRPAPRKALYAKWEARHNLALLYVEPALRRQGIGSRLLRAVENWLYYCPVYVGGPAQPCYGTIEGPRPPFFGGSQRMGVSARDTSLLNFLAYRGYHVVDPGEISMRLDLTPRPAPPAPDLAALGLRLLPMSHENPFRGREPKGREEYTLYGDNGGFPYFGYVLVTADELLQGQISWYPMRQAGHAAIAGFWVAPSLRGKGLGAYLLDLTLHDLCHASPPASRTSWGSFRSVEVQTHLVKHAQAAALYERRGFVVDAAWVNLQKECSVRGSDKVNLSQMT
jgi:GNAT superfamily N-acetyltransferase